MMDLFKNNKKEVYNFITFSIKKEVIDEKRLKVILEKFSLDDLKKFWMNFIISENYSNTQRNVPDWRTRDKQEFLKNEVYRTHYYPQKVEENGGVVYDREDFELHIKSFILEKISNEITRNKEFKERPFLIKFPFHFMKIFLVSLLLFPLEKLIDLLFPKMTLFGGTLSLMIIVSLLGLYLFSILIIKIIYFVKK